MSMIEKVAVIGLDCFEPSLVFERWLGELPNLRALVESGQWGRLESCLPPITVPAWSCMATSKDPGTLGVYGFRNRRDWSYENLGIATNHEIREPRVWDLLARAGRPSITVGVPQTFPILPNLSPLVTQITCFLTPSVESPYTNPPELREEIARLVGEYLLDIKGFRTDDKDWLLGQIYEMTDKRFAVCRNLVQTRPWNLFWMVEMGTDRIHHGYWANMDERHHRYERGNKHERAIHDYYVHLDRRIGELLAAIDRQRTAIFVVSDHGAKRMDGGICFNDWLIREGYLVMKEAPERRAEEAPERRGDEATKSAGAPAAGSSSPARGKRKFEFAEVDWARTRVWGEGGYYGRCFINVAGREPRGIVAQSDYEALRDELTRKLETMPDPQGRPLGTRVYKPEKIYRSVRGVAPDLVVIFGDLHWRSVGTIGNPDIYTYENDTGPDDANHAQQGMYILSHPALPKGPRDASLYDVTPTILRLLGQPMPDDMVGRPLV